MSNQSPAFLLRTANALVDEVAQSTSSVLETARQLANRRQGFMDSLRGAFAASGLVGELESNLRLAIRLCDAAAHADSNLTLNDRITPSFVKAKAFFQQGLIAMEQNRFDEAVTHFGVSAGLAADQATYLNIGLCFLQMKRLFSDRTENAVAAFQKCIDLDPESEIAITAGKELARLGRLTADIPADQDNWVPPDQGDWRKIA